MLSYIYFCLYKSFAFNGQVKLEPHPDKRTGLWSTSSQWPLAPYFCSWTKRSKVSKTNKQTNKNKTHKLITLDLTGSEH